jgi:hypothetical protein
VGVEEGRTLGGFRAGSLRACDCLTQWAGVKAQEVPARLAPRVGSQLRLQVARARLRRHPQAVRLDRRLEHVAGQSELLDLDGHLEQLREHDPPSLGAVDAVFRACPVVALPGYSRPVLRVRDYLALLEGSTYDRRTRVR